uniref:Uncharacterized protein n=1 Tax=Stegastes partitus TaxID=144197 RepID=A0A3B4ZUB3_9TELE
MKALSPPTVSGFTKQQVSFSIYLQSDVKHHRGHQVDIRESDSQPPCEIKKYQQSPRQAFGEHPVRPPSGAREPEH